MLLVILGAPVQLTEQLQSLLVWRMLLLLLCPATSSPRFMLAFGSQHRLLSRLRRPLASTDYSRAVVEPLARRHRTFSSLSDRVRKISNKMDTSPPPSYAASSYNGPRTQSSKGSRPSDPKASNSNTARDAPIGSHPSKLRIACVQFDPKLMQVEANIRRVKQLTDE